MAQIYRCIEPFAFTDKHGVPRSIAVGTLVSDDDPDFKNKLNLFESADVAVARSAGVETATAEPGSLRSVSTKFKKAPAKAAPRPHGEDSTPTSEER
jgi:hypothetical protein